MALGTAGRGPCCAVDLAARDGTRPRGRCSPQRGRARGRASCGEPRFQASRRSGLPGAAFLPNGVWNDAQLRARSRRHARVSQALRRGWGWNAAPWNLPVAFCTQPARTLPATRWCLCPAEPRCPLPFGAVLRTGDCVFTGTAFCRFTTTCVEVAVLRGAAFRPSVASLPAGGSPQVQPLSPAAVTWPPAGRSALHTLPLRGAVSHGMGARLLLCPSHVTSRLLSGDLCRVSCGAGSWASGPRSRPVTVAPPQAQAPGRRGGLRVSWGLFRGAGHPAPRSEARGPGPALGSPEPRLQWLSAR